MKNLSVCCWKNKNRIPFLYAAGVVFVVFAAIFGIVSGSTAVSWQSLAEAFKTGFNETAASRIFLYVRLPRTAAALICGAALAVSGGVIQCVLANKLASPSIIGVNAGAGLAVTVCAAMGFYGGWITSGFAFAGAFATVMAVSLAARRWGASRGTVILIGVAVNSLLGAFSDSIVTLIPEVGVMRNDFKIGDFSAVSVQRILPAAVLTAAALIIILTLSNELDVLTLGEEQAKSLGLNVSLMRLLFLVLAAMLAGCAVSLAGLLSFVGLIVPHAVRRVAGSRSIHLTGLSALYGGGFVCLCDTLARTVFSPYEIPVGIIMAFLGAPFFVFILIKGKGGHGNDRA